MTSHAALSRYDIDSRMLQNTRTRKNKNSQVIYKTCEDRLESREQLLNNLLSRLSPLELNRPIEFMNY